MRILFLSAWFPYPPDNGSKIRIYNLLQGLSQYHDITLLTFVRSPGVQENLPALADMCQKVEVVSWKEFNPTSPRALIGFASRQPRSVVDTFSPQMEQLIRQELANSHAYDLIIASQLVMAAYYKVFDRLPALVEEIELAAIYDRFAKAISPIRKLRHGLAWLKTSRYVTRLLESFQACTVVSERERAILSSLAPAYRPIEIIPNCLDIRQYKGIHTEAEPYTLIFTGALTFSANYDALCFFLRDIYPSVKQAVPEVTLRVTGRHEGVQLPAAVSDARVQLTGYVDDIKPLIASSWGSIVPLRGGGGTRLKILEALALGTPIISTSKGAEGLEVEHGRHLLIADTPREFATAVVHLLKEPALRDQLGQNGRQLVYEKYDWAAMMPRFLTLVESLPESASPKDVSA